MMAHALLGPSGASRWLACTKSAKFEEACTSNVPGFNDSSPYAEEGTAAHEYADNQLQCMIGTPTDEEYVKLTQYAEHFRENNQHYCGEMEEAVELYVQIIQERLVEAQKRDSAAFAVSEQKLEFTEYVPEGFGTSDANIISDKILDVFDFKYGKGVPVDAKDNPQLRLYGLGAYLKYSFMYDIETIRMTIVQPRLSSVTTDEISVSDLLKWAEEEVKPKAAMAFDYKGSFVPGDHCGFCKGKPYCKALAKYNLEIAKHEFMDPNRLTDTDTSDILLRAARFKNWIKAVEEHALDQAVNHGKQWPGMKVVSGTSRRSIANPDEAVKVLKDDGYDESMIYKPKELEGITKLEKLCGKKHFAELLNDYIIKPPGKPALVAESDKRPAINSAEQDFKK